MVTGSNNQSFVLRRRLRTHSCKPRMPTNPERPSTALCKWSTQRIKAASSIAVVLGATLESLKPLGMPCLRPVIANDATFSNPVLSTPDSVSAEGMALKLTACHNNRLPVPNGIIKCGKYGCSTQTYKRWQAFLHHLGIDLPSSSIVPRAQLPRKRSASATDWSDGVTEEPMELPLGEFALGGDVGRQKVQKALGDLQNALQNATTSADGRSLLTPLELQTLVIGCHTQCLVSELLAEIKATYEARKMTRSLLNTCRRLWDTQPRNILFPELEWNIAFRKKQSCYSLRSAEVTTPDIKRCLYLTMEHIQDNADTLGFLSAVLRCRKEIRQNKTVASMVRDALKTALPRYRRVLSAIASHTDVVRLCTLFQVPPPPLPPLVRNNLVPVDEPRNLSKTTEPYHFQTLDTVRDVVETLGALSHGATILQLLRLAAVDPSVISSSEMKLVNVVQKHLKYLPDDFLSTEDLKDRAQFQNSIMKNSYARDCLDVVYPDYLEFAGTQIKDQMIRRFETVIHTVGFRIRKFVDQAVVCNKLMKTFKNSRDMIASRVLERLEQYGKEILLACDLITRKVNEMRVKSRESVGGSSVVTQLSLLHRQKEQAERNASLQTLRENDFDSQVSILNKSQALSTRSGLIIPEGSEIVDLTVPSSSPVTTFPPNADFRSVRVPGRIEAPKLISYRQGASGSGKAFSPWNIAPLAQASPRTRTFPHETAFGTGGISGVEGKECVTTMGLPVRRYATNPRKKQSLRFLDLAALKYRVHKIVKGRRQKKKQSAKKEVWRPV